MHVTSDIQAKETHKRTKYNVPFLAVTRYEGAIYKTSMIKRYSLSNLSDILAFCKVISYVTIEMIRA